MTSNELEIFKQSILDDVRVMMQTTGQVTQYIGARYVPLLSDPLDWSDQKEYEPLTIVTNQGNSYTSRQFVPKGVPITNEEFWACTGNFNAQIEQYRQEVKRLSEKMRVFYFDSANEMMKNSNLKSGDICKTLGFNTIGDDGAALYVINDSEPDGFSKLGLANGKCAELKTSEITAEMFGAKGDGVHDDSNAINKAIDYISKQSATFDPTTGVQGGKLVLLNKHYLCKNSIILKQNGLLFEAGNNVCGITLEGSNKSATILDFTNVDNGIECNGCFAVIKNLTVNGANCGIKVNEGSPYFLFENIYVKRCGSTGFELSNNTYMSTLINCTATICPIGFKCPGLHTSITFINCYANNCETYGYYLRGVKNNEGLLYSSLISCGADDCGTAYYIGDYCRGFSMISCGSERSVKEDIKLKTNSYLNIQSYLSVENKGKFVVFEGGNNTVIVNNFNIILNNVTNANPIFYTGSTNNHVQIDKNYYQNNLGYGGISFDILSRTSYKTVNAVNGVCDLGEIKNYVTNSNFVSGIVEITAIYSSYLYSDSNQAYYTVSITKVDNEYTAIKELGNTIVPDNNSKSACKFTFSISNGRLIATHATTEGNNGTYTFIIKTSGNLNIA